MVKTKIFFCITIVLTAYFAMAQSKPLKGKVIAGDDVEGIHILNKTASKFSITDSGGSFTIYASILDTITISGLKYDMLKVVVTKQMFESGLLQITLKENVNLLDEVVVGKVLTGSLISDIENSDIKAELNFYDLGIPGFTGTLPTQNERRLADADGGKFVYFYGVGLAINIHKILNRVNGNTKTYRARFNIESKEKCIRRLRAEYSETIFQAIALPEHHRVEFFQFCVDDNTFKSICEDESKINDVDFLIKKLALFKNNLDTSNGKE